MDQRTQKLIDNYENMKIDMDTPFKFHCTQCGKCCINREDIILNPLDLFKASKALGMAPQDFVEAYCDTYLGESSHMPIVRIRPRGSIKRCPLMKDRKCSIHEAKPSVCAMFPVGRVLKREVSSSQENAVSAEEIEYIFINPDCGDNSETHTVREWFGTFGIPLKDEFFVKWYDIIFRLGPLIQKCIAQFSEETAERVITLVYIKLYLSYDTSKEFWPQFIENAEYIMALMKLMPDKGREKHV